MALALCCLRACTGQITRFAEDALLCGGPCARAVHRAVDTVNWWQPVHHARLALLLRAVLRADAGDFGRWRGCDACDFCRLDHGRSTWANGWRRLCAEGTHRYRPLWEQAPERKP